ncbi:MAG: hypothetical protein IJK86_03055 [Lachnospiraceae bacterium]|nr:hypothetical protein [Lachnospiraceae bacterium]
MNRKLKTILVVTCSLLVVGTGAFVTQQIRFQHEMNTFSTKEYNRWYPCSLSSPIEAIMNDERDYISLYDACYRLNDMIPRIEFYCKTYAMKANSYFLVSSLSNEKGTSIRIPDDVSLCDSVTLKLALCFSFLQEYAIRCERNDSLKNKTWLEKVLLQTKRFDSIINEAELPETIRSEDDVVSYLVFIMNLDEFAEELHQTLLES